MIVFDWPAPLPPVRSTVEPFSARPVTQPGTVASYSLLLITASRISYVLVVFGSVIHGASTVTTLFVFDTTLRVWPAPAPVRMLTMYPGVNWFIAHDLVVS